MESNVPHLSLNGVSVDKALNEPLIKVNYLLNGFPVYTTTYSIERVDLDDKLTEEEFYLNRGYRLCAYDLNLPPENVFISDCRKIIEVTDEVNVSYATNRDYSKDFLQHLRAILTC